MSLSLQIQLGEAFSHQSNHSEYPVSAGWTLKYAFRGWGGSADFDATPGTGDTYILNMTALQSMQLKAGSYSVIAYFEKAGVRKKIDSGTAEFIADYLNSDSFDSKSYAEKTLEAVEATIQGRATQDHLSYTINGRSISKIPLPDLLKLRSKLKNEIANEDAAKRLAKGLSPRRQIAVRFPGV